MKKLIILSLAMLVLSTGCKKEITIQTDKIAMKEFTPKEAENAVIYEVNIRQYSSEGTFNAFTKDIPVLKELGVKILWLMPVQPISMTKRKATADLSIEDITDPEERKKYLGSYYAISDYDAIHPDYGTLEDFKNLVETAHDNGIYVILDWVADHTGWDHNWIHEKPEFYHKNAQGEITDPLDFNTGEPIGWSDVAHLDYSNQALWDAMTEAMLYWLKETNIDGFRCDVADMVPVEFWEQTRVEMEKIKPVFMLAESDHKEYLDKAFDMGYDWKIHHLMNAIAKGEKNVKDLDEMLIWLSENYPPKTMFMYFTSNHDENAWKGTEYQRMGDAAEVFAAMTYMLPGMPLIYNGQEYASNVQLKFFEKDEITRKKGKMFSVYKQLGKLKNENPALNGGIEKADFQRIQTSNDAQIMAFVREKDGHKLYFIANLSAQNVKFTLPMTGTFENYMPGEIYLYNDTELEFTPWQYWILKAKN
ncbi:MAG: alpha-amylase family glycosyl hydrolase [Weeksellaceae bacterium]